MLPSRTTPSWKEQFGRVILKRTHAVFPLLARTRRHTRSDWRRRQVVPERRRRARPGHSETGRRSGPPVTARRLGRRQVEAHYTWERVADRMYSIYKRLSEDKPHRQSMRKYDPAIRYTKTAYTQAGRRRTILFLDHTASLGRRRDRSPDFVQHLNGRARTDLALSSDGKLRERLEAAASRRTLCPFFTSCPEPVKIVLGAGSLIRLGPWRIALLICFASRDSCVAARWTWSIPIR